MNTLKTNEESLPTRRVDAGSTPRTSRRTARERRETAKIIDTGIDYDARQVYRLVGRDLYSAPAGGPLAKGEYTRLRAEVIDELNAVQNWRVIMRSGRVCLTSGG